MVPALVFCSKGTRFEIHSYKSSFALSLFSMQVRRKTWGKVRRWRELTTLPPPPPNKCAGLEWRLSDNLPSDVRFELGAQSRFTKTRDNWQTEAVKSNLTLLLESCDDIVGNISISKATSRKLGNNK